MTCPLRRMLGPGQRFHCMHWPCWKNERDGIYDCQKQVAELKQKGFPLTYV